MTLLCTYQYVYTDVSRGSYQQLGTCLLPTARPYSTKLARHSQLAAIALTLPSSPCPELVLEEDYLVAHCITLFRPALSDGYWFVTLDPSERGGRTGQDGFARYHVLQYLSTYRH